jgi:hypothetical protein
MNARDEKVTPPIRRVWVRPFEDYVVGREDVVEISFGSMEGTGGLYRTVQVFKSTDQRWPFAVFPFHNCVGVYYGKSDGE